MSKDFDNSCFTTTGHIGDASLDRFVDCLMGLEDDGETEAEEDEEGSALLGAEAAVDVKPHDNFNGMRKNRFW